MLLNSSSGCKSARVNFFSCLKLFPCLRSITVIWARYSVSRYSETARNLRVRSLVIVKAEIRETSGGSYVYCTLIKLISCESRLLTAICRPTGYNIFPVSSSPNSTQSWIPSEQRDPKAWWNSSLICPSLNILNRKFMSLVRTGELVFHNPQPLDFIHCFAISPSEKGF